MISINEFIEGEYLTMVTKNGIIKKTLLSEFEYQRKGGKIAINLDDDDELIFVRHTKGDQSIMIATRNGMCVRFDENNVRGMGRAARGVKGITLIGDDYVIGVAIVDEEKKLLTVTEKGMGKRTSFEDFREMKHRGGKGVACHKISDKSGHLAAIQTVSDDDDVMLITDKGTIIRMSVSDINVYSRTAGGVIVMRMADDTKLITLSRLEKIEEIELESEKVEEENRSYEGENAPKVERASLEEEENF
jgi:DNA gyrase subunit A